MSDLVEGTPHPIITAGEAQRPMPPRTIIPVQGLPIVVLILAGLIAAIATGSHWALMLYHVAGGGLWTGIDLFVGFVVGPILGRLSIPARAEFSARFMPLMAIIMPTLVSMTLASGFQVAVIAGNLDASSPNHAWLLASFIVVGIMATIALGILEPANIAVLFEMRKPAPDGQVIAGLMRRFIYTAGITGAMQIATLVIMTRIGSR